MNECHECACAVMCGTMHVVTRRPGRRGEGGGGAESDLYGRGEEDVPAEWRVRVFALTCQPFAPLPPAPLRTCMHDRGELTRCCVMQLKPPECHRALAALRGDAGLHHRHLLRQDRHAHHQSGMYVCFGTSRVCMRGVGTPHVPVRVRGSLARPRAVQWLSGPLGLRVSVRANVALQPPSTPPQPQMAAVQSCCVP
jgi:hypothetical protein